MTKPDRGTSLTEFALVAPLVLLILFGVIEFGRYVGHVTSVVTAAREGARYGVATGDSGGGVPRFVDCDEIRAAARSLATLADVADTDITISYDHGPGSSAFLTCPAGTTADPAQIITNDRIVVTVTKNYTPVVPLAGKFIGNQTLTSTAHRTIVKDLS